MGKDPAEDGGKGKEEFEDILAPREEPSPAAPGASAGEEEEEHYDRLGVTQVDDVYLARLQEKIEESEPARRSRPPGAPPAEPHVSDKPTTRIVVDRSGPACRSPAPPPAKPDYDSPLSPFAEKTTQKLDEELAKGSSQRWRELLDRSRVHPARWRGTSLYVLCGPDAGKTFYVAGGEARIGRGLENEVVLKDISVSREHCVLRKGEDGRWSVEDLSSDNGTYIDGRGVTTAPIRPGQFLQLGRTTIVIEVA